MVSIEVIGTPDSPSDSILPSVGLQQLYIFVYNVLFILIPVAFVLLLLPIPFSYIRAYLGPRGDISRAMHSKKTIKKQI